MMPQSKTDDGSVIIPADEYESLKKDKARLDWLDHCNRVINERSGNLYGWKVVVSPNVARLVNQSPRGRTPVREDQVDISDANALTPIDGGVLSCRVALDRARAEQPGEGRDADGIVWDSIVNKVLLTFAEDWQLDGDLIRCKSCKRGIIFSRRHEPLNHRSDCKTHYAYPWAFLGNILSLPDQQVPPA